MKAEDFLLTCPIKKVTGEECPGCGAQTAAIQVLRGDFAEAFHTYPAIYTVMLFFAVLAFNILNKKRSFVKLLLFLAGINVIIIFTVYFIRH